MVTFAVTAPHLSPDQHYALEDALTMLPGVDAFFNEEGILGTEVTAEIEDLSQIVNIVYAWSARHETSISRVQFTCPDDVVYALADFEPADMTERLSSCRGSGASLRGMKKRLADDGMHDLSS